MFLCVCGGGEIRSQNYLADFRGQKYLSGERFFDPASGRRPPALRSEIDSLLTLFESPRKQSSLLAPPPLNKIVR